MVQTATMDVALLSWKAVDWRGLNAKVPSLLAKLSQLTVPTFGWTARAGEFIPVPDNPRRAVLRIFWQSTGTVPIALIGAGVIIVVITAIIGSFTVITAIKTATGEGIIEDTKSVIERLNDDKAKGVIDSAQYDAAMAAVTGAVTKPSPLSQSSDLLKTVLFGAVILIGGVVIVYALGKVKR